jgi:hypothetical protein
VEHSRLVHSSGRLSHRGRLGPEQRERGVRLRRRDWCRETLHLYFGRPEHLDAEDDHREPGAGRPGHREPGTFRPARNRLLEQCCHAVHPCLDGDLAGWTAHPVSQLRRHDARLVGLRLECLGREQCARHGPGFIRPAVSEGYGSCEWRLGCPIRPHWDQCCGYDSGHYRHRDRRHSGHGRWPYGLRRALLLQRGWYADFDGQQLCECGRGQYDRLHDPCSVLVRGARHYRVRHHAGRHARVGHHRRSLLCR